MPDILLQEGRKALSEGKWKEAKTIFERAVEREISPELFEELARACWWLNEIQEVLNFRTKAYQLFLDKNDKLGASRNASWLGIDYLELKGEFAIANGWFQRAENLLEGLQPSLELGLIKLLKARLSFVREDNNENALKLLDESMALNKKFGAVEVAMMAEALKGFIFITEGRIKEGMALLDEATLIATTAETKDVNFVTLTCCFLIDACERIRDYERAGQWCLKVKEICKRWQFDAMFASCRNLYASVLIWYGDWKEAESELVAAAKELEILRPGHVNSSTVRLADLKRKQGKWDEAAILLELSGSHSLKLFNAAAFSFDMEDYTTAANLAERYFRQIPAKERTARISALELLIRIYLKQARVEEATTVLNELKEIAAKINTIPLEAAVKSAEGFFYYASGKWDEAENSFEDAVYLFDKINTPFESAQNRTALAEVFIKLSQYQLAEMELNISLKVFRKLGAEKDIEKTNYLLKNMHKLNAEMQGIKIVLEFTGRELEVLRLLAEGKNNEEIAKELYLSVRTIEKHLSNLYIKMGVSGKSARAFAASYAIKHNLVFK